MSVALRLTVTAALLCAAHIVVLWLDYGYTPAEIEILARPLSSLPKQLDDWSGEDATLDERLVRAIGARDLVSRTYRNPKGRRINLHSAVIGDGVDGVSHYPEYCYAGSGWQIVRRDARQIGPSSANPAAARQLTVERNGSRVWVLYWYRMGDQTFVDRDSFRSARKAFFGQEHWPPTVKVLISVPFEDTEEAESQLIHFAEMVDAWIKEINRAAG